MLEPGREDARGRVTPPNGNRSDDRGAAGFRVRPAARELIQLASVMRPDWDLRVLNRALQEARDAGWTWRRTFTATARLLVIPDSDPKDLTEETRDPRTRRAPTAGPTREYEEIRGQMKIGLPGQPDEVVTA